MAPERCAARAERQLESGCVQAVACCTMCQLTSHCVATAVAQGSVHVGLCFRMTPVIYAGTLRTLRRLHVETCIGSPGSTAYGTYPWGLVGRCEPLTQ